MQGIKIGEILVEQGVLDERQVEHILAVQRSVLRPFGDLAERLYGIDPQAVEDAWVEQYMRNTPAIDLSEIDADKLLLRMINRRQAWQFHISPVDRDDHTINIATTRDRLIRAVNFASRTFNEPVGFLIAEKQHLRDFLMRHYPVPAHLAEFAETF